MSKNLCFIHVQNNVINIKGGIFKGIYEYNWLTQELKLNTAFENQF